MNKIFIIIAMLSAFSVSYASAKNEDAVAYNCSTNDNNIVYCLDEKGKPLHGKRIVNSEKGYTSIENYKNGYQDGLSTYWDENGSLYERVYFKNGIKNGMDKIYYPNRSIKFLTNYKEGILDGRLDIYSSEGKLLGRIIYKNGVVIKGECVDSRGRKKDLTSEQKKNVGYNELITCGVQ